MQKESRRFLLSRLRVMLRTIAALIGASAAAAAHAIPVTVTFSGVVAFYRDLSTGSLVRENAGLPVSGFITYDSDRAQTVSTTQGPPLTSFSASSKSGCRQVINGACTQDSGPFSSVVIDYRFSFGQQDFGPLAPDLGYYAASGHYTLSRSSGSRIWNSHLDQDQALITGDLDSSYQRHFVNRSIELTPSSTGPLDLLTGSPLDPTVGFDLAAVPSDQLNLFFEDYRYSEACTVAHPVASSFLVD
jgi:hypothetical protein